MKASKKRRIKVKIKKKNFAIFIILTSIFTSFIYLGVKWISALTNSLQNKKTSKIVEKKKETKKVKKDKFDDIKEKLNYYNENYKNRYEKYQNKNKDLSLEQVIKDVNMNIDIEHYEDTEEATHKNTIQILVNKHYYLPKDYVPKNLEAISNRYALSGMKLVSEAKEAYEKMAKDAEKQDLNIVAMSTYRSYNYQVNLYNRYAKQDGKEKADTYSGRPGYSEHQTGLAMDVYNKKEDYTRFEKTEEFKWMQKHAHEYGFILRYPKGKEKETGYQYESWHYRYVGEEIAKYIYNNNISFEEYYATKIKDW